MACATSAAHKVARGEPRALSAEQYAQLLRMPDLRTTAGKRDLRFSIFSGRLTCAAPRPQRC
jgi:hypothetical protein